MSKANILSNKEKSIHGYENQESLTGILSSLLEQGYISDFQQKFRIAHPTASNTAQFYAPFMIQFMDRSRWVIFSTTSMRTDRIKGQQWDAYNLKSLDTTVTKAILAYSPESDDVENFKRQDDKYTTGKEISAIDRIIDFDELVKEIKEEALVSLEDEVDITSSTPNAKVGKIWDKKGKSFERYVAEILQDRQFFAFWKKGKFPAENKDFMHFKKLLDAFDLDATNVIKIETTADKKEIGYLPSGGSPKTDVIADITLSDGKTLQITISCKRSKCDTVSIHQYTADTFADVLAPNNAKLRKLLNDFQYFGNVKDLPPETEKDLKNELNPLLRNLSMWVVGGFGAEVNNKSQFAKYIVSYQTTKDCFSVHKVEDYCNLISTKKGTFGTPFNWTYASKQRGKSIQLKAPVL